MLNLVCKVKNSSGNGYRFAIFDDETDELKAVSPKSLFNGYDEEKKILGIPKKPIRNINDTAYISKYILCDDFPTHLMAHRSAVCTYYHYGEQDSYFFITSVDNDEYKVARFSIASAFGRDGYSIYEGETATMSFKDVMRWFFATQEPEWGTSKYLFNFKITYNMGKDGKPNYKSKGIVVSDPKSLIKYNTKRKAVGTITAAVNNRYAICIL